MHVGGRTREDIDAGGVLGKYSGVLVRDGYAGYEHLTQALHAWCGAHLLRYLRALPDTDPTGQLWALAMANTLLDAHHTARTTRAQGIDRLEPAALARIRNLYRSALARGQTDNKGNHSTLATDARTLIRRFRRYEDMILRFATDLTVPFTNNTAERAIRPVKIQQRTSGGTWRTPPRTRRLRHRPVLPGHHHQIGPQQTRRPPQTLHHRSLATTSPQPSRVAGGSLTLRLSQNRA